MKKIITESAIRNLAIQEVKNILNETEPTDKYRYPFKSGNNKLLGYTDNEAVNGEWPEWTKIRLHKPGTNQDGIVKEWNGEEWVVFKSLTRAQRDGDIVLDDNNKYSPKEGYRWVTSSGESNNYAVEPKTDTAPQPQPEPAAGGAAAEAPAAEEEPTPELKQWDSDQAVEKKTRTKMKYTTDGTYWIYDNGTGNVVDIDGKVITGDIGITPEQLGYEISPPKPKVKQATSWDSYVGKDETKEQIKALWLQLTGGGTLQEALQDYDSTFQSYVQFYRDELKKQKDRGGKAYISPEAMIELLKSKMASGAEEAPEPIGSQAQPAAASQLSPPIEEYKTLSKKLQTLKKATLPMLKNKFDNLKNDKNVSYTGLDGKPVKGRRASKSMESDIQSYKEQIENIERVIRDYEGIRRALSYNPAKDTQDALKQRLATTEQQIKSLVGVNEAIINESTYNRWQKLIKG